MAILILHWAIAFLCNDCVSTVVLIILLGAVSVALIPFSDWLVLCRAARRESSIEHLEALFALEDRRGIGSPRARRARGTRL